MSRSGKNLAGQIERTSLRPLHNFGELIEALELEGDIAEAEIEARALNWAWDECMRRAGMQEGTTATERSLTLTLAARAIVLGVVLP